MYISKPKSPEELYNFYTKGMPLMPRKWRGYRYNFKRKGWNTFTRFIKYKDGNEAIRIEFYSAMNAYRSDWILEPFKYVEPTEQNQLIWLNGRLLILKDD